MSNKQVLSREVWFFDRLTKRIMRRKGYHSHFRQEVMGVLIMLLGEDVRTKYAKRNIA